MFKKDILDRLKHKLGVKKDADLARELGIIDNPSQRICNARNPKRTDFPWQEIYNTIVKKKFSFDEIYLGKEGGDSKTGENQWIYDEVEAILNSDEATILKRFIQEQLGKLIDVTAGAICNYEKGRRPIRAHDLEKIKALYPEQNRRAAQGESPAT